MEHPPTIIVVHPRERRSKCTVEPLRDRDGYIFHTFPERGPEPLDNYVRLGFGGPLLSDADGDRGLLVLDATWRLVERMENVYHEVPVRSLPACETAYPRKSKNFPDPGGGLATIEAVYLACRILDRDTTGLLDDYYWADEFLRLNGWNGSRDE